VTGAAASELAQRPRVRLGLAALLGGVEERVRAQLELVALAAERL
jgi:hypothetical protein